MLNEDKAMIPPEALTALRLLQSAQGGNLIGVYLHGSAAMSGLRGDSDVDLLAVLGQGLSQQARKTLSDGLIAISGKPGSGRVRPIELIAVLQADLVPWRYPPRREYLYGEWLREGFQQGEIQGPADDPDLSLILAQALRFSVPLLGPELRDILDPVPAADVRRAMRDSLPGLLDNLRGDERNVLLTLARMWCTASGGGFTSKDAAAGWTALRCLPEDGVALLRMAEKAYRGEYADCWDGLGEQVDSLAQRMKQEILASIQTTEQCPPNSGET